MTNFAISVPSSFKLWNYGYGGWMNWVIMLRMSRMTKLEKSSINFNTQAYIHHNKMSLQAVVSKVNNFFWKGKLSD